MAITSTDNIAAGLAGSRTRSRYFKLFTAAKAVGSFQSGWLATGNPGPGAAPPAYNAGSGYTADKSTAGAMYYVNASSGINYLARLGMASSIAGTLIIADRLWSCSGMGFAASTYTVTTPGSLPARITDNGLQAELYIEQFAAAGSASGTAIANYKDSSGGSVSGTIAAVVSAPVIGQMQLVPSANNLGVKQLTSIVTSNTWTSGSFGATILQPLLEIPLNIANVGQLLDWGLVGLPALKSDMCLMAYWLASATTAITCIGSLDVVDK